MLLSPSLPPPSPSLPSPSLPSPSIPRLKLKIPSVHSVSSVHSVPTSTRRKLNNIHKLNIKLNDNFVKTFNLNTDKLYNMIDIYKYVYKYIQSNFLQDSNNKWLINPDKTLLSFLKEERDREPLTFKNIHKYLIINK